MLTLVASLVFFSLTRLSVAQFNVFPACVQPLLTRSFPASCLSTSLTAQNSCLCNDAATFGPALVKGVNQACGCADLLTTSQLIASYCAQVGIDTGPAFQVFIQDDTTCDGSTGTAAATPVSTPAVGSSSAAAPAGTSVPAGGSTAAGGTTVTVAGGSTPIAAGGTTVTVASGSTPTAAAGNTVTVTGGNTVTVTGGSTSTGTATTTKTSGANRRLFTEHIVGIFVGVAGGILALC